MAATEIDVIIAFVLPTVMMNLHFRSLRSDCSTSVSAQSTPSGDPSRIV